MLLYRVLKKGAFALWFAIIFFMVGFYFGVFFCPEPALKENDLFYAYCKRIVTFIEYHNWLYGKVPNCKVYEGGLSKSISCEYCDKEDRVLVVLKSMQNNDLSYRAIIDKFQAPKNGIQALKNPVFTPLFSNPSQRDDADMGKIASDKNAIMDDLLAREDIPEGYAAAMEALYRDRSNDDILRGFAVQHFPLHAETLARRGQFDASSPEAARVRETLFEAARETSTSVGGTALLALERLSHTDSSVDCEVLAALVLRTAADDSANPATRLAAVQLCGTLRLPAALPLLRTLSADDSANTTLRLAARHSLSAIESATMPPD